VVEVEAEVAAEAVVAEVAAVAADNPVS